MTLLSEPIQELHKTIGQISHALIEHANVISNPGVPGEDSIRETSRHLRKLSSQLQAHLYLVPAYDFSAKVFRLPHRERVMHASGSLIGLSNSLHRATDRIYEQNARKVDRICDCLGIYRPDSERWPDDTD